MNEIYISKPFIQQNGDDLYRLCANVKIDGQEDLLYVEVEKEWKDYFCVERADAFLFLMIPIAIRNGYNIRSEAPITDMFLHNISEILLPTLVKCDSQAKSIKIISEVDNSNIENQGAIATAVSCGVDSTYTIMQHTQDKYNSMKLTHLVVGSVSKDLWNYDENDDLYSWVDKYQSLFERYDKVSEYTGLPLVKIFTNFTSFMLKRGKKYNYKHIYVHAYITIGTILALRKLFGVYIFSSGYDFSNFTLKDNLSLDTANYELLLMHVLTTPDFFVFSGGGTVDRIEKTIALTEYPLAKKHCILV